jgi:asparagine synthase (glutamine-hydrolysing)
MSGIAGIYNLDGKPVAPEDAEAIAGRIAHRGPDRQDVWRDGAVALANVLLRTTPEALHEAQPLRSRDGHVVLTADARIDNRSELIRLLDIGDQPVADLPDSTLILAAYQKWGTAAPEKLVGDFSFALWDAARQQLLCARDPVGIRPFYYHHADRLFAFASESRALLALSEVPAQPNERKILAFLTDLDDDREATFYAGVRRLLPGHVMVVQPGRRPHAWRYWKPEETVRPLNLKDDRAYEEGFREVFEEAVRSRLRSITPVGIQLSGGMDSTSVASVARHLRASVQAEPIHTFTGIFPSLPPEARREIEERAYVDDVLALGGFEPHFVRADQVSPLDGIEELVGLRGEPFMVRGHYFLRTFFRQAREQGIRVILDGSEGDIVVGYGYDYFGELAEAGDWQAFSNLARTYAENCRQGRRNYPPSRAFWNHGFDSLLAHARSGRWPRLAREAGMVARLFDIRRSALTAALLRRLAPEAPRRSWRRLRRGPGPQLIPPQTLRKAGLSKRASDNTGSQLERHARAIYGSVMLSEAMDGLDPIVAGFHVEARHPFFDKRLMEYCLALPPEQRLKGGWTRSIMRRALRDVLPESLQKRVGKSILGINATHQLHQHEQERLQRVLHHDALRPFVSYEAAKQAYQHFNERPTWLHTEPLLRMAILTTWFDLSAKE